MIIGTTGLGKVNAAITTAALLERFEIAQVWNIGCAGAFEQGPLRVGDVLLTSRHLLGDEGVLTDRGPLPATVIGIPVLVHEGTEYFEELPSDQLARDFLAAVPPGPYKLLREPAPAGAVPSEGDDEDGPCFRFAFGPSLTVSMASGDASVAEARFRRFGAHGENMEGSAVAQACLRFGVPFVEFRGISNTAGNRSRSDWRLSTAIANCRGILARRLLQLDGAL